MAERYQFEEFELDTLGNELRHRGTRVPLEPKALDLLTHLLRHRDRIVSVPELLTVVWADTSVERGSVHRAVRLLRRAFSTHSPRLEPIKTYPRSGYRLTMKVDPIAGRSHGVAGPVFVGRESICAELDARLGRAVTGGKTELIVLHGPAGIGKSATLAWLLGSASRTGITVLEGRCIEGPAAPTFGPWSRILRAALRLDGAEDLAEGLGEGVQDVARALPEIGAALGIRPLALGSEVVDQGARYRVHIALAEWIRHRCRRGPLIISIDDLHRADLDSIELLAYLIQDLSDEPLVLAIAYRDGPEQIVNLAAVDALIALRPAATLRLAEFSRSEVEQFARERSRKTWSSAEFDQLVLASGGNPLFIEQLVRMREADRDASQPDPRAAGLRGALRRLLEDASEPCTEMLSLACVFGRVFAPATLAAGLERSALEIQTSIDEAIDLRLLEPDEAPEIRFVHGLLPEVFYAGLSATERTEQHRRAVNGILATRGNPHQQLNELGHHAYQAAALIGIRKAFDFTTAAASDARKRLAYEDAIQLFERALAMRVPDGGIGIDSTSRANCLVDLATLMVMRGAAAAARPYFDEAAEIAREEDDPILFARAALGPSQVEEFDQLDHQRFDTLHEAVGRLGDRDPAMRVRLLNAQMKAGYYDNRERTILATEEALEIARSLDDPELLCGSLLLRSEALGWTERHTERVQLVREANEIAKAEDLSPMAEGLVLRHAAYEALTSGDRSGYEEDLKSLERMAKINRLTYFDWIVTAMRGTLALLEGRFEDVRSLLTRQLEIGRHSNPVLAFQIAGAHTVMMEIAVGDTDSVIKTMRIFIEQFPDPSPWQAALAVALADSGHPQQARDQVNELIQSDFEPRHRDFLPVVLAPMAQVVRRIEDAKLAQVIADELARIDDRCVVVGLCLATYGAVDRYRGHCEEAMGNFDAAVEFYERGLQLDETMGAHPFIAHGLADLGGLLLRKGGVENERTARQYITRAGELATRLGMQGVLKAIRQLG